MSCGRSRTRPPRPARLRGPVLDAGVATCCEAHGEVHVCDSTTRVGALAATPAVRRTAASRESDADSTAGASTDFTERRARAARWCSAATVGRRPRRTSRTGSSTSSAPTPSRQGQGLGAMVIAPVLERCDAEGVRAYLDSTNPRNRPFYRRLGFVRLR